MYKVRVCFLWIFMGCIFDFLYGYCILNGYNYKVGFNGLVNGYSYYLEIIEDLDDGCMYDDKEYGFKFKEFEGVRMVGICEVILIY